MTEMTMTDVEKIAALAREGSAPAFSYMDGRRFVVVPDGSRVQDLSDPAQVFAPAAPRIRQAVTLTSKQSLIDYVRDFGVDGTRIFADLERARFHGAIDFHLGNKAGSRDHNVELALQLSEEWTRWGAISGKLMKQAEFARWLEENLGDIETPSGADVLEIVRDMSAAKKVDFSSAVRLANGDTAFEWVEETTARSKTGMLEVPTMFVLRIPVFYGEPPVELRAFLRWNIDGGSLAIGIELHRPAYVKQAVFEAIGRDIAEQTGRPLHFGRVS